MNPLKTFSLLIIHYPLLEMIFVIIKYKLPPNSRINSPGKISSPQHQHPSSISIPNPLHLNHKLSLNSPTALILALTPGPRQRVNLIDKDNRRLLLPGQSEQSLDQLLRLSNIFTHQVTTRNREESRICLGGASLGQVSLTSARRTIQQDPLPRLSNTHEDVGEF